MTDKFVTDTECALRTKNIEQSLKRIESAVESVAVELKDFKEVLNPSFNKTKQQLADHIEQDRREKERRKERWSSWQIVITSIVAVAAVGMFIVSIIK